MLGGDSRTLYSEVNFLENSWGLIKDGRLVRRGGDYVTDDGVMIRRCGIGKRGSRVVWKRDDDGVMYRGLYEAYYKLR